MKISFYRFFASLLALLMLVFFTNQQAVAAGFGESHIPIFKPHSQKIGKSQKDGRAKNKLSPDSKATGDHTVIKRDSNHKITNYATYKQNPKNPSGFDEQKRVDLTGRPHINPNGTVVNTPHVHEQGKKEVRPAQKNEVPKQ